MKIKNCWTSSIASSDRTRDFPNQRSKWDGSTRYVRGVHPIFLIFFHQVWGPSITILPNQRPFLTIRSIIIWIVHFQALRGLNFAWAQYWGHLYVMWRISIIMNPRTCQVAHLMTWAGRKEGNPPASVLKAEQRMKSHTCQTPECEVVAHEPTCTLLGLF